MPVWFAVSRVKGAKQGEKGADGQRGQRGDQGEVGPRDHRAPRVSPADWIAAKALSLNLRMAHGAVRTMEEIPMRITLRMVVDRFLDPMPWSWGIRDSRMGLWI